MKNRMLPEKEIKLLREIIEKVDELAEVHNSSEPDFSYIGYDLCVVHSVLYMKILKEFLTSARCLKELLDAPEDKVYAEVTENGKHTLEEVKVNLMMSLALEILGK